MKKNITLRIYPELKKIIKEEFGGVQKFLDIAIEKEYGKVTKAITIKKETK